jgi:hypothetical protein
VDSSRSFTELAFALRSLEPRRRVVGQQRDARELGGDAEAVACDLARLLGVLQQRRGALDECCAFGPGLAQQARSRNLEARQPVSRPGGSG